MQKATNDIIPKCRLFDCELDAERFREDEFCNYCEYHNSGGIFGSGEAFEQYQIIEQDFLDFIRVIPINEPEHHSVYSPVLRDILIRCCVQIEIFFKEWGKFECTEDTNSPLLTRKKDGLKFDVRNWNFADYIVFKDRLDSKDSIYVLPINDSIDPFADWKDSKTSPWWWKNYNSVKHGGYLNKKDATLRASMYALAGLFLMHCRNPHSKSYLNELNFAHIKFDWRQHVLVETDDIRTPIDSKKYLFKAYDSNVKMKREIVTSESLRELKQRKR